MIPVPLADGLVVEAVAYASGTLCLSSQAGCAVGCPFCASGSRGLRRNLNSAELWLQVSAARAAGFEPRRLTLSGVGEPLQNVALGEFLPAAARQGLPVSLTTCGAPLKRLAALLELPHNGVMLSLHAGTAETHRRLIPRAPEWEPLWEALACWYAGASRRARRRLGFNYLLLAGVNDTPRETAALLARLRGFPEATLHLLQLNRVAGGAFASPPEESFTRLHAEFRRAGLHVRRGNRWRRMASGGCGTLFVRHLDQHEPPPKESRRPCQ